MLVDTSVWIDHLRKRSDRLAACLEAGEVWTHPFVIGELACGRLSQRNEILGLLATLPQAPVLTHESVLAFVDARDLAGRGLGWVDMHLLASAREARLALWSLDRRLARAAEGVTRSRVS